MKDESGQNRSAGAQALLHDVSGLLWHAPRAAVEKRLPPLEGEHDYTIGMTAEESAFICGLIRERKPQKILEAGVNKGGTTAVILRALGEIGSNAELYCVDLNPEIEVRNTLAIFPEFSGRARLMLGRDVSAFLEEIGGGIDFCILDTAHYLPGEILNFLCILPYLKDGATVVIHDQTVFLETDHPFVQYIGPASIIACRVLFDCIIGEKLVPNFARGTSISIPNIASLIITRETRKYIGNLLSSLMLPWRFLPDRKMIDDVSSCLRKNYPAHYVDYFSAVVQRQLDYHLKTGKPSQHYWETTLKALQTRFRPDRIAFHGAGEYCRKLLESVIPADLHPGRIFDRSPGTSTLAGIPVLPAMDLRSGNRQGETSAIVITSNAHHADIYAELLDMELGIEIIDPFDPYRDPERLSSPSHGVHCTHPAW